MFFRRKKDSAASGQDGAGAPGAASAGAGDGPAGGSAAASGSASSDSSSQTQFLTGDQAADRHAVQILLEAMSRVAATPVTSAADLEALFEEIVDLSIEVTSAERGLLLIERVNEQGEAVLDAHVARSGEGQSLDSDVRFSTTIAKRVLEDGQPVRATVQSDTEALELGRSVFDLKLRAVMCVPLAPPPDGRSREGGAARKPIGALYVDSRAAARQFQQRDLSLFAALASQISGTMQKAQLHLDSLEKVRLEQSLELASTIQRDLMPRTPFELPGIEVHGWYRAAEQAAGDFYDIIKTKGERLGVLIGDVTGHGIGPALITASAQASLRSYLRMVEDSGEAVTLVNQDLSERMDDGRFVTLFVATIAEDGRVETLNAGHPPAIVYSRAEDACRVLGGNSPALGMIEDETYACDPELILAPGDALLAYTDGAAEARSASDSDQMLGDEGVAELFAQCMRSGKDARETALSLAESVLGYSNGVNDDDITLVVVRRQP